MAALIGALRVSLSADSAKFEAGMKKAQSQAATSAAGISKSLGLVRAGLTGFTAGLSLGLLSQGIKSALEYAGSIAEVAQQLGVTSRDLQLFRFAAGQVGVSQEQLETGLQKLTITLGKVAAGAAAPTKALEAIGLSAKDLAGLDAGATFRKIADGLAPVTDRAKRAAVEVALFGKSGANLDNLLSGGSSAINELSSAAEKLGIVLSDEQIQRADDTADKLEALKTVLAAQISGVVADNAQSILGLATALSHLTSSILGFLASNPTAALAILGGIAGSRFGVVGAASGAFAGAVAGGKIASNAQEESLKGESKALLAHNLKAERDRLLAIRKGGGHVTVGDRDRLIRLTAKVNAANGNSPRPPSGTDIGQFLAPAGPKSPKPKADHSAEKAERAREKAIREAYRADEDDRRAQMDILRAKESLAHDYSDRTKIQIQMLDLEKQGQQAEVDNQVALGEITQAQADRRMELYNVADALKRQAVLEEEQARRREDYNALEAKDYQIKIDHLQKQSDLAQTAAERRTIELQILDLAQREQRERLERIIAESKDWAEIEAARRDLLALNKNQGLERQGVMNSTRGPWEDYLSKVPDTAAKMEEALQSVKVNAVDGLVQGLSDAATGAQKLGDVFKNVAKQIVADLIRIQIQKAITGALGRLLGSGLGTMSLPTMSGGAAPANIPAFATGGSFSILGRGGVDSNIMSLNGLPIARVSHGERVHISNDNVNGGGGSAKVTIVPTPYFDAHVDGRAANVAAPMASRAAMVGAAGGTQSIMRQQRKSIP